MQKKQTAESAENCSEMQKEIAEKAQNLIVNNLEKHLTIAELAQALHVSTTQVKVCFRSAYGVPIYAYSRRLRMEAAAKLLEETDDSILEIAGKSGYENGSKFAKAFRDVMGAAPGEYRRRILWEKSNADVESRAASAGSGQTG